MQKSRHSFKIVTGIPIGKGLLGRLKYGKEDNVRIDNKEINVNTKNWTDSALDRDF